MHSTESASDFPGLRNSLYTQGARDMTKRLMTFTK